MRWARAAAAAVLPLALFLAACSAGPGTPGQGPVDLTVLGAASLKGVLAQAKSAYETAHKGVTLTISTGSSAALATQVEQGAPADVFLSADTGNPQRLADGGFTAGEPVAFAGNELAVIVPKGNPGGLSSPADLGRAGVKVIAAGDAVPITAYATRLVANLAKHPGYPAGFEAAYAANIMSREDSAKAVVAKIELGEGDAGIVYATDAEASGKADSLVVPVGANVRATYAGVVVKASAHPDAAAAFLAWLAGPDGAAILRASGFLPAP
jgi:molybdate transport system substrate-binding protein